MNENPKVCVLMSTYNGERYIKEQVHSILRQDNVDVQLLIRDDGSSDSTINVIQSLSSEFSNISYSLGSNIGPGKSFMLLLNNAPDADYYAFADQDDIWICDKLNRAISLIQDVIDEGYSNYECFNNQLPVLYASNLTLVDSDLKLIKNLYVEDPSISLFDTILSSNKVFGCTIVMNRELKRIIANKPFPSDKVLNIRNHDAWVLACALVSGLFVFDSESRILYRQHDNNVVGGIKKKGISKVIQRLNRLYTNENKAIRSSFAGDIIRIFGDSLDGNTLHKLDIIINANDWSRFKELLSDKELIKHFHENRAMIAFRFLFNLI